MNAIQSQRRSGEIPRDVTAGNEGRMQAGGPTKAARIAILTPLSTYPFNRESADRENRRRLPAHCPRPENTAGVSSLLPAIHGSPRRRRGIS